MPTSEQRSDSIENSGPAGLGPEGSFELTDEAMEAALSAAFTDVARAESEVAQGRNTIERVAAERGAELTADERTESDEIVDEAKAAVAEQKEKLSAWGDLDTTAERRPAKAATREQKKETDAWGELDMVSEGEAAKAAAEALELSRNILEGKTAAKDETAESSDGEFVSEDDPDVTITNDEDDMLTVTPEESARFAEIAPLESAPKPVFDLEDAKRGMDRARMAVDDTKAALKNFGRAWTSAGKAKKAELEAAVVTAKEGFEKARGEYVGADAMRMLEERLEQVGIAGAERALEKGFMAKGFERAHGIYKKLGEYNAQTMITDKLGITPNNRLGRMMLRGLSARTIVSAALLGGGLVAGAGSAAGIGAMFTRRVMAGIGGAGGSYDLMRMAADRSLDSFDPSDEELAKMEDAALLEKMETMEARAMTGGKSLDGNPVYQRLQEAVQGRLETALETVDSEEEKQAMLELFANDRDVAVAAEIKSRGRKEGAMTFAAIGVGAFIGTGTMARMFGNATRWAFDTEVGHAVTEKAGKAAKAAKDLAFGETSADAVAAPHESVVNMAPPTDAAVEAPSAPGVTDALTEVHKGDGYVKIFARQMEADPAKFGYDAAKDGDTHKWAMKLANKIAKEQGLTGKGLRLDHANVAHVTLNADHTFAQTGAHEYVRPAHHAVPETHAEAPAAEAAPHDTLSHVETYVDADGTPYYQHDWKQFKFAAGLPESTHEEIAHSIDMQGKEIQAMTHLMEEARAKYGKEAWFNKFDLMMQKQIRGSYVDWRHNMRVAAGVDKGTMYVNQAVPDGDPKKAAKMVFEATRAAGGYPAMDLRGPSLLEKTVDIVTGGSSEATR